MTDVLVKTLQDAPASNIRSKETLDIIFGHWDEIQMFASAVVAFWCVLLIEF